MKQPVIISIILASAVALSVSAEDLTLSQCRTMALSHNTSAEMQQEAIAAAEMLKKASVAAMMPKASANAGYVWNSSDLHLLGNQTTGEWGTVGVGADGSAYLEWANAEALNHLTGAPVVGGEINQLQAQTGQAMADAYKQLCDRLTVDMTHIVVAQVGITQPIYMGGRLHEMHKLASSAEKMAELTAESLRSDIVVKTDEAYWRVVNVEQKQQLAHKYYDLLKKLEGDVRELQAEGLATQSDLLNVTAKLGEAEVKRLQADNGLILSKMALCQVIGLPLDADIHPVDAPETNIADPNLLSGEVSVNNRYEMQLLQEAQKMADSHVRLAAAGLQPNIVAQANYLYTNPYAQNGLSSDFRNRGTWNVGVVVNIPIAHAEDICRLKAAKHEARMAELKVEESRELLTLQVTQARQKLMEAQQNVVLADLNLKNADQVLYMAQESFDAGMVAVGDLMQAQTAWLSASTDRIDALVNLQMATATLQKYTGTLITENLQ